MKTEFLNTLEQASWPAVLVDSVGTVLRANSAAGKVFGAPLEGTHPKLSVIWSMENPQNADQFLLEVERVHSLQTPLRFHARGGAMVNLTVAACLHSHDGQKQFLLQFFPTASPAPTQSLADSATAQKHKLDVALQLARTVALDFNNALTGILGHTSLLLSQMDSTVPWRRGLLEIEKAAARAAEIANDLGNFSHAEREAKTPASGNINEVVLRVVDAFRQAPREHPPEWSVQLERTPFLTRFDEAKMHQAITRVLENALDALGPRGRINIATRNLELAEPTQDRTVRLAPGTHVSLEIADNGSGIPPEVLPRVFEPFFTTKTGKEHRGLGLALAYGIVSNHGGGIAISSQPGKGTSVRLYLPAEPSQLTDDTTFTPNLDGTETVLVVDDEDLMLSLIETVLSAHGYKVLKANGAQKALDLISETAGTIDLLITDLVMPGMSGRELTEHVSAFSPSTRIIRMSGYVWPAGHAQDPSYLQKPFSSPGLLRKVRQVLSQP